MQVVPSKFPIVKRLRQLIKQCKAVALLSDIFFFIATDASADVRTPPPPQKNNMPIQENTMRFTLHHLSRYGRKSVEQIDAI